MEKILKRTVAGLIALGVIATVIIFSSCIGKETEEDIRRQMVRQTPVVIGEEKVGGKYNVSILTVRTEYKSNVQTWYKIKYTKNNKTIRDDFVYPNIRNALEWIKLNTPEDALIMGWWDYGRSIEGYTGRGVVVETLSKEMLPTVSEYLRMPPELQREAEKKMEKEGVPHEKIMDAAKVLTTKNPQEAIEIMKKYNASYLFVHSSNDVRISHIFFFALGVTPIEPNSEEFGKTIIGKASEGQEIDGFKLVYSDENVKLYNIKSEL